MKKLKSRVIFHNQDLFDTYKKLENGTNEEKRLYKWINRAIKDLKEDAFSGLAIPKDRIPKKYNKEFEAKTIWKYDLPNAFRLIYTIENNDVEVYSIFLEWMNHKNYDRLFKY